MCKPTWVSHVFTAALGFDGLNLVLVLTKRHRVIARILHIAEVGAVGFVGMLQIHYLNTNKWKRSFN